MLPVCVRIRRCAGVNGHQTHTLLDFVRAIDIGFTASHKPVNILMQRSLKWTDWLNPHLAPLHHHSLPHSWLIELDATTGLPVLFFKDFQSVDPEWRGQNRVLKTDGGAGVPLLTSMPSGQPASSVGDFGALLTEATRRVVRAGYPSMRPEAREWWDAMFEGRMPLRLLSTTFVAGEIGFPAEVICGKVRCVRR